MLQRSAVDDLWRHTLSQIPSVFGRLVYLAALRNPNTGIYEHHGLTLIFGEQEAAQALKRSHTKAFAEWLEFNLEQQKADLDLYLSGLFVDKHTLLRAWLEATPKPYQSYLPPAGRAEDGRLYLADLTTLIRLMQNVYGVADPHPDALPLR